MKIEINELLFAKMMNSVKHCVPIVDVRTALTFIKLKISNDKITAYSCDGYRAARTTIELQESLGCHFECYIKPITFKPSKSGRNPVVIDYEDKITSVEVITKTGKVKYFFEQPVEAYADIDKIYDSASYDRRIGMNPNFVKSALNALSQIPETRNKRYVVLETQENSYASFKFTTKAEGFISEQLIVPMRITEND